MKFNSVTIARSFTVQDGTQSYVYDSENSRSKPYGITKDNIKAVDGAQYFDVTPRKGEELTFLELPIDPMMLSGIIGQSYNCVFIEYFAFKILGWIDGYETTSTAGSAVRIKWHVDYFLTCQVNGSLTFGEGRFKRYSENHARPDPSEPRMWKFNRSYNIPVTFKYMGVTITGPFCVIVYLANATNIDTYFFPITEAGGSTSINYDGKQYGFPNIYEGSFLSNLELDPDKVVGCYASPIPPTTDNDVITVSTHGNYAFFGMFGNNLTEWQKVDFGDCPTTNDMQKVMISDPYDVSYATLPYGLSYKQIYFKLDLSPEEGFLTVRFRNDTTEYGEGRDAQIPLIGIPVNSNAWSSYNYSGQRDYDKTIAQIQREQNRKNGVANSGTSAIGGAVAGSITGNPLMAGVGAIAGLASSIAGSYATEAISSEYDAKTQEAVDRLTAQQTSSCLITGSGNLWCRDVDNKTATNFWKLVVLSRDPISKAELEAEHEKLGFVTDFYCADCTTLIAAGGPMKIENLKVKGLSKAAQNYIATIFNNGIYIDKIGS